MEDRSLPPLAGEEAGLQANELAAETRDAAPGTQSEAPSVRDAEASDRPESRGRP